MDTNSLKPFFSPRGIAVIGASQDPTRLGYGLARNLVESNYPGSIHLINPRGGILFDHRIYKTITEVPDPVDLAVLLIPAQGVVESLIDCGRRGIKAAVIGAGGFKETGPEGAALELECLRIAKNYDMRLIGPNSIGLLNTHLPFNATFLPPPMPEPGDIAFISQSGAICASALEWARSRIFGLSHLISLGNQADLTETDLLAPIAADSHTRVLALYLESVSDGKRFIAEASCVSRQKPIIALKLGRFLGSQRAAASHTGALAGSENAYNSAFQQAGVMRAKTTEELFDWARALAWCPTPGGRKVAILTNAGGPGVAAADALEAHGLQLSNLSDQTRQTLIFLLPPAANIHNPVDMLASASPDQYSTCLRVLLNDPGVEHVMVIMPPPPMYKAGDVARALIPVIHTSNKPVVMVLMGEKLIQEAAEVFRGAHIPEYRFPERAASALAALSERAEYLSSTQSETSPGTPEIKSKSRVSEQSLQGNRMKLFPRDGYAANLVEKMLQDYGIPVSPTRLAHSANEAREIAAFLNEPVVLKIASPDIMHKSDVNGVLLNVQSPQEAGYGYDQIIKNTLSTQPSAKILGVTIQAMAPQGQDVIIGAVQDNQFGALVMFGSGGIEVEGLRDISFGLAPLLPQDAERMVNQTWAGRKLSGFRSIAAADRPAVIQALQDLGRLADENPDLAEIEINPLRVLPENQGVLALDIRVKWETLPDPTS